MAATPQVSQQETKSRGCGCGCNGEPKTGGGTGVSAKSLIVALVVAILVVIIFRISQKASARNLLSKLRKKAEKSLMRFLDDDGAEKQVESPPMQAPRGKQQGCTSKSYCPLAAQKGTPPPQPLLPRDPPAGDLTMDPLDAISIDPNDHQRQSIYDTTNMFYSTADVDPLIAGQAYAFRDNTRDVYTGRTAVGGNWGLQEFSVDNSPGMVGVDVGPNALSEYEGSILGYNDGIPEQWQFPSTPIRWYRPRREDHFGHDGPEIVNKDKLYSLFVADHDPQIGADPEPEKYE